MNEPSEPIKPQLTNDIPIVNLNTATVEELSRLPGIAARLAGRIIDYRTNVHPFREPAEITQVRGVSAALYAGFADLITVGPVEPEETVLPVEPEEAVLPAEPEAPALLAELEEPELKLETPVPVVEPEAPAPVHSAGAPELPSVVARELPPAPPPPSPAPAPREPLRSRPQRAPEQKGGAGWPALLAVGLVSAIAGACLALLLLLAINRTLKFGPAAEVGELRTQATQLGSQAGQLAADLGQVQRRLGEIDERLAAAQAELGTVKQEMARVGGDVQAFQGRLGALEAQFGGLAEDLQTARQAARRLNAFLTGLRELLDQGQGPALDVTPLPKAPNPTLKPAFTVIPQPTSTPKP